MCVCWIPRFNRKRYRNGKKKRNIGVCFKKRVLPIKIYVGFFLSEKCIGKGNKIKTVPISKALDFRMENWDLDLVGFWIKTASPILTHRVIEPLGFVSPRNEDEVDGNTGQDHQQAVAGFHRASDHRDDRNEHRCDQVEDREEQIHPDRALQIRLGPPKPR